MNPLFQKPWLFSFCVFVLNLGMIYILFSKYQLTPYFFSLILLMNLLFVIAAIDYCTKKISDYFLLPTLVLGVITIFFIPQVNFYDPLITAIFLGLIMFVISKVSKEAIGMGDVKLITCLTLFFGLQKILSIIFLSLMFGLVFGLCIIVKNNQNLKTEIPFVPCIFLSTLVQVLA